MVALTAKTVHNSGHMGVEVSPPVGAIVAMVAAEIHSSARPNSAVDSVSGRLNIEVFECRRYTRGTQAKHPAGWMVMVEFEVEMRQSASCLVNLCEAKPPSTSKRRTWDP